MRDMLWATLILTSVMVAAFNAFTACGFMHCALTRRQPIFKAHPNVSVCVCGHGEPGLALDVAFRKIDIPLRRRVDDFDVNALTGAGPNVGSDDDERVRVSGVPYAFSGWESGGWKDELDGESEGRQ